MIEQFNDYRIIFVSSKSVDICGSYKFFKEFEGTNLFEAAIVKKCWNSILFVRLLRSVITGRKGNEPQLKGDAGNAPDHFPFSEAERFKRPHTKLDKSSFKRVIFQWIIGGPFALNYSIYLFIFNENRTFWVIGSVEVLIIWSTSASNFEILSCPSYSAHLRAHLL